jgi:hypothetical protein
MFSVNQKREIADAVQRLLRFTGHPELPQDEIQFRLRVSGAEAWSWADIRNNGAVDEPGVNQWNESQAARSQPVQHGAPIAVTVEPGARFNVPAGARWKLRLRPNDIPRLYVRTAEGTTAWALKPAVDGVHDLAIRLCSNRRGSVLQGESQREPDRATDLDRACIG